MSATKLLEARRLIVFDGDGDGDGGLPADSGGGIPPTISADPNRIRKEEMSNITWSGVGITCEVTGPNTESNFLFAENDGTNVSTGQLSFQSIYTLSCDGIDVGTTTVYIIPSFIEI